MKVLKTFAVLTAVLVLGACETAPKEETVDPTAFLNAVKGKTITITAGDLNGVSMTVSADGKTVTGNSKTFTFVKAKSPLIGVYKDDVGESDVILNSDKKGGTFKYADKDNTFTIS